MNSQGGTAKGSGKTVKGLTSAREGSRSSLQHHTQRHQSLAEWQRKRKERRQSLAEWRRKRKERPCLSERTCVLPGIVERRVRDRATGPDHLQCNTRPCVVCVGGCGWVG